MRLKLWSGLSTIIILLALLLALPVLSACGGEEPEPEPTPAPSPEPAPAPSAVAEIDVVKDAVASYVASPAPNIKAADLHMMIAEGDAPYIVSLRSAEDYAKGHIPGAVNMKFGDLSTISMDEEIVVYCYTGQSASFAAAVLGVQGYDVSNLLHGMSSWSDDPAIFVSRFDPATSSGDFSVETAANAGGSYALPDIENTASDDAAAIVKAAAATVTPSYITAADLNMKIAEGEDMTIIDLRSADHYAAGHIPGAINIGLGALADNLAKINPDAPVYCYCYTGHTAAQATSLLQMLGYDASSLKFGMCGWSSNPDVNLGKCFNPDSAAGYDTES
ncbi:MAG: rhodanese-like domain-containing protein [Dehalococcoidales bacterium]|nr:rhodanese-like domain-containing protein [Dehalococcoidales bacterium]